jgi:hypothetical protein
MASSITSEWAPFLKSLIELGLCPVMWVIDLNRIDGMRSQLLQHTKIYQWTPYPLKLEFPLMQAIVKSITPFVSSEYPAYNIHHCSTKNPLINQCLRIAKKEKYYQVMLMILQPFYSLRSKEVVTLDYKSKDNQYRGIKFESVFVCPDNVEIDHDALLAYGDLVRDKWLHEVGCVDFEETLEGCHEAIYYIPPIEKPNTQIIQTRILPSHLEHPDVVAYQPAYCDSELEDLC